MGYAGHLVPPSLASKVAPLSAIPPAASRAPIACFRPTTDGQPACAAAHRAAVPLAAIAGPAEEEPGQAPAAEELLQDHVNDVELLGLEHARLGGHAIGWTPQCVSCDNATHGSAAPAVDPEGSGGQTRALTLSGPPGTSYQLPSPIAKRSSPVLHSTAPRTNTIPTASRSPPAPIGVSSSTSAW